METIRLTVTSEEAGQRADSLLARRLEGLTRSAAARLLEERRVTDRGRPAAKNLRVQPGQVLEVQLPEPEEPEPVEPLPEPEEPFPEELSPEPEEPLPVRVPRMELALKARFFTSSSTPYFHRSPVTSFRIRRSICPCSFSV